MRLQAEARRDGWRALWGFLKKNLGIKNGRFQRSMRGAGGNRNQHLPGRREEQTAPVSPNNSRSLLFSHIRTKCKGAMDGDSRGRSAIEERTLSIGF